jgi:hypothetical protein
LHFSGRGGWWFKSTRPDHSNPLIAPTLAFHSNFKKRPRLSIRGKSELCQVTKDGASFQLVRPFGVPENSVRLQKQEDTVKLRNIVHVDEFRQSAIEGTLIFDFLEGTGVYACRPLEAMTSVG